MKEEMSLAEIERNIDKALTTHFELIEEFQSRYTFFKFLSVALLIALIVESFCILILIK